MKSKQLKTYNIPTNNPLLYRMGLKPKTAIFTLLVIGSILSLMSETSILGFGVIMIALFALLVLPDRTLLDVFEQFLVIYDSKEKMYVF